MTSNAEKTNQTATSSEEVRPETGSHRFLGIKQDDWVIIAIFLFCAVVYGITLTFDDVPPMIAQGLPPDRFPQLMVGVILLLTVILYFENRNKTPKVRKTLPPMVYYSVLLMVAFVLLVSVLDVLIAMPLFVIGLAALWGERRFGRLVAYAIIYSFAVFFLFSEVMEVVFPNGPITLLFR